MKEHCFSLSNSVQFQKIQEREYGFLFPHCIKSNFPCLKPPQQAKIKMIFEQHQSFANNTKIYSKCSSLRITSCNNTKAISPNNTWLGNKSKLYSVQKLIIKVLYTSNVKNKAKAINRKKNQCRLLHLLLKKNMKPREHHWLFIDENCKRSVI